VSGIARPSYNPIMGIELGGERSTASSDHRVIQSGLESSDKHASKLTPGRESQSNSRMSTPFEPFRVLLLREQARSNFQLIGGQCGNSHTDA
jgi:hypothetical protein